MRLPLLLSFSVELKIDVFLRNKDMFEYRYLKTRFKPTTDSNDGGLLSLPIFWIRTSLVTGRSTPAPGYLTPS